MRKVYVFSSILIVCLLGSLGLFYIQNDFGDLKELHQEKQASAKTYVDASSVKAEKTLYTVSQWKNLYTYERLDAVKGLVDIINLQLPTDIATILLREIKNKKHGIELRYNMGLLLIRNSHPEMKLTSMFHEMMYDKSEKKIWRIMSLEFFARSAASASPDERGFISRELMSLINSDDIPFINTAIHEIFFASKTNRYFPVPAGYIKKLHDNLKREDANVSVMVSSQGVLAQLGYIDALPEIRKNAQSDDAVLLISSIAALGLLGAPEDIVIFKKNLLHSDERVAKASAAALKIHENNKTISIPKPHASIFAAKAMQANSANKKQKTTTLQKFIKHQNNKKTDLLPLLRSK